MAQRRTYPSQLNWKPGWKDGQYEGIERRHCSGHDRRQEAQALLIVGLDAHQMEVLVGLYIAYERIKRDIERLIDRKDIP